jgi:hypothetical protein
MLSEAKHLRETDGQRGPAEILRYAPHDMLETIFLI